MSRLVRCRQAVEHPYQRVCCSLKTIQKFEMNFEHFSCFACGLLPNRIRSWTGQLAVNVSQSPAPLQGLILGTFSHKRFARKHSLRLSALRSTLTNQFRLTGSFLGVFSLAACYPILFVLRTRFLDRSVKLSPRHISTGPLHSLRNFHSQPINLIIFEVPYQTTL